MNEFNLIQKYFENHGLKRSDVLLGIGDDGALLQVPAGQSLVVSTDTFIEAVHFPKGTQARDIGYKALAVNLSDVAAMGATPAWFTLALTLPAINETWLTDFSAGLFELADRFNVQLVGGDTTRGALSITITVHGFVPHAQALLRSGARVGDKIYVSGTLGDAGLGLQLALHKRELADTSVKNFLLDRLNKPTPRVALGQCLRGYATSAIDISDGLAADLNHILERSQVGACIDAQQLPLSPALRGSVSLEAAQQFALTSGDDYELCFTLPPHKEEECLLQFKKEAIAVTCIGAITTQSELVIEGFSEALSKTGFQHFGF